MAEVEGQVIEMQNVFPNITEAYLVDDGSVVIATPKVPWWKQRRTKILLGFYLILIVAVLAVSLKIALASRTATTLVPSSAPSISQIPSLAPSACSNKVITNMRQIDLSSSNPANLKAAIHGDSLVIAWQQYPLSFQSQGSVYIAFYSRKRANNDWIPNGYEKIPNVANSIGLNVVLSGRKALIGLPIKNTVYAFVLSNAGRWEKVPFPSPTEQISSCCKGFGEMVYMCENLVAVSDSKSATHFFKENGGQWNEIERKDAMRDTYPSCSSTNPYSYSATSSEVGVYIDQMLKNTKDSKRIQTLSSSVYGEGFGNKTYGMSMDEDLLVIGSAKHTHVFAREAYNGVWEEVLRFDQSYNNFELSGRTLIAVDNNEVYSMSIADCTPEIGIQDLSSQKSTNCSEMSFSISYETEIEFDQDWDWGLDIMTSEFLDEDSILVENYAGWIHKQNNHTDYTNLTDNTICLSQGWYRIVFRTALNGGCQACCYNVRFDFPKSSDESFEFDGCVDNGWWSSTTDEVHFDIPRTTLRTPPTPSPTIPSPLSISPSPIHYPTTKPPPTT